MTARNLLALVMLTCATVQALPAQVATPASETAILRGTVRNTLGQPLVYAIASISGLSLQQFSNNEGKFYFVQLKPGKYVVSLRQLGYTPVFRNVVLEAGANESIDLTMERIVTQLATMRVSGEWACDKPGRPMADSLRPLIEVFEQIEQNAVRLKLLSREYPFDFIAERKVVMVRPDGSEILNRLDSTRTTSSTVSYYKTGEVLQRVTERGRRNYSLMVPTLLDFANPLFHRSHCFLLRGVADVGGQSEIRVDFLPSSKLRAPDVGGSVFLEAGTFRLLRAEFYLTKIPNDLAGLAGVRATTHFEEVVRGLPTISEIVARSDFVSLRGGEPPPYRHSIEHQRTLRVHFLKTSPVGIPPTEYTAGASKRH